MAMVISPDSEKGKELAKWEQPNYRPHEHPFPKMLYQARRRPDGVPSVGEGDDRQCGGQPGSAETFNRTTQKIVGSDAEMSLELERGWRLTPQDALAFFEERAKALSTEAAHRHHDDRGMSELAKKEAAAADDETPEHMGEVPRKRVKPRGRPKGSKNKKAA